MTATALKFARRAKHHVRFALPRVSRTIRDEVWRRYAQWVPYAFRSNRYPLSFVSLPVPECPTPMVDKVPNRIFVVWAGANPMSLARRSGLESIRQRNPGLEIVLVTPSNLEDYVVKGHPLHPAYELLSLNHRADYLRSYLLHHHGGGYSDLKPHPTPWRRACESLEADPQAWIIGYEVPSSREAAWIDGAIGKDIHRHFARLIGTGGMIAKAYSQLTYEWALESHRRLDYYHDLLRAHPGNAFGDNDGYPIPWTTLGSQILEPLSLKFLSHVRQDEAVRPQLWGHR